MQKQLEVNPFPGPHTFVSIPNPITAFIIGHNGEKVKKLHQQTGAYIFIPKDYNSIINERKIQLSGNDNSVKHCKKQIKDIVKEIAPLLQIDLKEWKSVKKSFEDTIKQIMQ